MLSGTDFRSRFDAVMYLRDFFYTQHSPREDETKPWRRIECATFRIAESEQLLDDKFPAVVRLRNAKRVRRAVREIVRLVDTKLTSDPGTKISFVLAYLEVLSGRTIEECAEAARLEPLH